MDEFDSILVNRRRTLQKLIDRGKKIPNKRLLYDPAYSASWVDSFLDGKVDNPTIMNISNFTKKLLQCEKTLRSENAKKKRT